LCFRFPKGCTLEFVKFVSGQPNLQEVLTLSPGQLLFYFKK
jgi:hypothetical protein